ncbi:hypothetical protein SAMN05421842_11614 [Clostridium uliginosum]|uniref:Uncharacterized protein n=1 Tax=Clostridium uliginosum TaxID=119641 RepID=A0A1I1NNF9_9CLOT|nr:hypothetical protein SAMN05421842_11614 [Clostridium uliginosum]
MKNIKKRFMLLSIIVLVFSLLYYLYPRSGSLNSFF